MRSVCGLLLALAGACTEAPRPPVPEPPHVRTVVEIEPAVERALGRALEIAQRGGDQQNWNAYADALLAYQIFDESEGAYLRAASLPGPDRTACLHLAGVAAMRYEPQRAVILLERALAEDPSYAPGHLCAGNVLEELGRPDAARLHFERARALHENDDALLGLGRLAAARGDDAEALDLLERAWRMRPGRPETAVALAPLLRRVGRDRDAAAVSAAVPVRHVAVEFADPLREWALADGRALVDALRH